MTDEQYEIQIDYKREIAQVNEALTKPVALNRIATASKPKHKNLEKVLNLFVAAFAFKMNSNIAKKFDVKKTIGSANIKNNVAVRQLQRQVKQEKTYSKGLEQRLDQTDDIINKLNKGWSNKLDKTKKQLNISEKARKVQEGRHELDIERIKTNSKFTKNAIEFGQKNPNLQLNEFKTAGTMKKSADASTVANNKPIQLPDYLVNRVKTLRTYNKGKLEGVFEAKVLENQVWNQLRKMGVTVGARVSPAKAASLNKRGVKRHFLSLKEMENNFFQKYGKSTETQEMWKQLLERNTVFVQKLSRGAQNEQAGGGSL